MAIRERVAEAIKTLGAGETARRLQLSVEATLRVGAGARVHRGTLAQAERNESALAAEARAE